MQTDMETGTTMRNDETTDTVLPNLPDFDKSGYTEERFMLDFLSEPDEEQLHRSREATAPKRDGYHLKNEFSKETDGEIWWDSNTLHNEILGRSHTVYECSRSGSPASENQTSGRIGMSHDLQTAQKTDGTYRSSIENGKGLGGSDTRKRRRREFHKIHTRRSRAKLNEKMETLRHVLPDPPKGLIIKSKAQIIDYAISYIAQWRLKEAAFTGRSGTDVAHECS